jgi:hypothetical protein
MCAKTIRHTYAKDVCGRISYNFACEMPLYHIPHVKNGSEQFSP